MGEYRSDPDFIERFRRLEERVAALAAPLPQTIARCTAQGSTLTTGVEAAVSLSLAYSRSYNMDVTGTKVTVTIPGLYVVTSNVGFETNATGIRSVRVRRTRASDGTGFILAAQTTNAISGFTTQLSATGSFVLAAGDYLELLCLQTSGGDLNIYADDPTFDGFKSFNVMFVKP